MQGRLQSARWPGALLLSAVVLSAFAAPASGANASETAISSCGTGSDCATGSVNLSFANGTNTSLSAAPCGAGSTTGPAGGPCVPCEAGTYKNGTGSGPCTLCYRNAHAPPASTSVSACQCAAGYSGASGTACTACAAGEYKSTNGSAACSLCAGGTYSGAIAGNSGTVCMSCPNHSSSPRGSSHVSNCTCEAGYAGQGGGACAECPAGTYKRSDGSGPCANCARGKYSSSLAQTACTACPADQTFSPEGSANAAACQCQPGSWRHTNDWTARALAGLHENAGLTDGIGSHARFEAPSGVAFNPAGTQVAVTVGKRISGERCGIRLVDVSSRSTSTIVISLPGFKDGTGSHARFGLPSGLAFSPDGTRLVVADEGNNAIRVVAISERVVTTLAGGGGGTGLAGFTDGTRALFQSPVGVAWTTGGHVIVSEVGSQKIRIIDVMTGVTDTLAGAAMTPGSQDGRGQQARFNQPRLLTLTRDESSVLVADSGNGQIRQVSIPHGDTTTLRNSEGKSDLFDKPYGVSVSPDGRLLAVSEYGGAAVEVVDLETGTHVQVLVIRNYFSSQRPGSVYGIAWSPRGPELVITTNQVETLHVLTGPGCEMCGAGSFFINRTGTELAETNNYKEMCGRCPLHTSSPIGSTSIYDCKCQKGYTGPDGEACRSCQPGTYKSTVGSASCFGCSNLSWSSNASPSIASCICNAGFVASDQGLCSACPAGTYQHVNTSGCIPCSKGKYSTALAAISESTCMACPPHSSSPLATGSPTGCTCEAGFEGPDQGFLGVANESCVACAPGTFKLDNSSSACALCAPGTFKENSGTGTCELCPANSSSESAGSMSMSACSCNAGYFGIAPSCLACEAGYYKQTSGSSDCVSCPEGAHTSDIAAVSGAACKCGAGCYRLAGGLENGYVRTVGLELGDGVYLQMYSGFAVMPDGLSVVALTNTGCIVSILLATRVARQLICLPGSNFYGSAVAAIPPDGSSFVVGHQVESRVYIINASLHMRIIGATYTLPWEHPHTCWTFPGLTDSDGSATEARFNKLTDLTVTPDGSTVLVADRCNAAIRRIDVKTGQVDTVVRTVRDTLTNQVLASGPGYAPFWMPQNLDLAPNGTILIVSDDVGAVYKVDLTTRDTTFIAGSTSWNPAYGYGRYQDGFGTAARFYAPAGVAISPDGETAYIADSYNHRIRNVNIASGQVGTFVGSGPSGGKFGGVKDGSPTTAEFNDIMRIAFVPDGSALLVAQFPLVQYPTTLGGHHWVNFLSVVGVRATGQCAACPAGTFSTSSGTGTHCSVCPQNSRSLPYSTRLGDCVCDRGYTGPDGGICSPCAAGKFKNLIGNHSCLPCNAHADSQTGASKCYCIIGHYEAKAGVCTPCGAGTYNRVNGSVVCERCSAGKYSNATVATECLACPLHSVSGQGSSYISNCTCIEGYSGPDGGECDACAAGTYKDVNGSDLCTLCAPGTYFAGAAATGCLACPLHSFSGPGSSNISNCICNKGYSGPDENGDPCSEFSSGGGTSTSSMSSSSTAVASSSTTADSSSTPLRTTSTTPLPGELSSSTTTVTTSASAMSSSTTTSKPVESSSSPAPTSTTTSHPVAGSSSTGSATTLASTTSSSSTPSPSTSTTVPTSSSTVTATTSSSMILIPSTTSSSATAAPTTATSYNITFSPSFPLSTSAAEPTAFFSTTPASTFTSPTHIFLTPTPARHVNTVRIVFALALSLGAFILDKQIAFKNALAMAADVSPADVAIEKIEASQSSRRNLLAEGIRVEVSIKVAGNKTFANAPASTFKLDKLNRELIDIGLPAATVVDKYGNVTPTPLAAPAISPAPGFYAGYVEISISAPRDSVLNVTTGETPTCWGSSASKAEENRLVITKSCTVTAISCRDGMGSTISAHRFEIYPGPVVQVKLDLKGPNLPADINQPTKDAFLKVFAALIGIPVELASIVSVKGDIRFLLSLQLNIEVITNSEESAERVRRAIAAADFSLALHDLGWHNVEIDVAGAPSAASEGSLQQSTQKSTTLPLGAAPKITQQKEGRLDSPIIAGVLVGAGLVLGLGLAGFFVVRWKWKKTLPKSDETQAPVTEQSRGLQFEDGEAVNSENDGASSHESDESDRMDIEFPGSSHFTERHRHVSKKDLERLLQNPEGTEERLRQFWDMITADQLARKENAKDDSSFLDGECNERQVNAELQGTVSRQANKSRNRAENESFESLFMDVEGFQKRREHLRATMQQARTTRKEQDDAVSSCDEEKKSRDVDAQLIGEIMGMGEIMGTTNRPSKAKRRSRAENSDLELLFMDPEGVNTRREQLLKMMKEDRSKRRIHGEVVSSDDDERDMHRIDAHIEGLFSGQASFARHKTRYAVLSISCLNFTRQLRILIFYIP
jgi:DNA-binding beta-propeller fold protein YncE